MARQKEKMKQEEKAQRRGLKNKARFWVGVGLIVPEILAMVIVGLTFVNWSFITLRVLGILAIILYNVLAGICIWSGSSQK